MTPTLESALSGLPAKPRVHELSKRIGITNKELLAALADRGLTISSASSSVPLAVAQDLIQSLFGGQQADPPEAVSAEPVAPEVLAAPTTADIPGDSPGRSGHEINPLFLPPAEFDGSLAQQGREPADQDQSEGESGPPARSGSSRRRRGRSGGGRRAAQDRADNEAAVGSDESVVPEVAPGDQAVGSAELVSADSLTTEGGDGDSGQSTEPPSELLRKYGRAEPGRVGRR